MKTKKLNNKDFKELQSVIEAWKYEFYPAYDIGEFESDNKQFEIGDDLVAEIKYTANWVYKNRFYNSDTPDESGAENIQLTIESVEICDENDCCKLDDEQLDKLQ